MKKQFNPIKSDEIPWLGAHPCIAVLPPDLGPGFLPSGAPVRPLTPNESAILVLSTQHPPTSEKNEILTHEFGTFAHFHGCLEGLSTQSIVS